MNALSLTKWHSAAATSVFLIMLTMVALMVGMAGCGNTPSSGVQIRDWHDLDAIRDNLDGEILLINHLDSTHAG